MFKDRLVKELVEKGKPDILITANEIAAFEEFVLFVYNAGYEVGRRDGYNEANDESR